MTAVLFRGELIKELSGWLIGGKKQLNPAFTHGDEIYVKRLEHLPFATFTFV
ncbi:MAG: hypothetical protein HKO02_11240 [Hyphomonadaceae bacterium]|nr:hypothetical protein [Hyphomonadaceae bacterium]